MRYLNKDLFTNNQEPQYNNELGHSVFTNVVIGNTESGFLILSHVFLNLYIFNVIEVE